MPTFLGNPTDKTYDFNFTGGGAIIQNKLWVNGTIRKWVVNKFVNAKNDDGTPGARRQRPEELLGQARLRSSPTNQKLSVATSGTTRSAAIAATATTIIPDIASVVQSNPVQTTQAKYTGIKGSLVYESNFSVMDGQTDYTYQPDTDPARSAYIDTGTTEVLFASTREEHQPNSRHQFDNVFTYGKSGIGGEHLFKGGVQWGRLYYASDYSVLGDHWLIYNNGVPTAVREFNSPAFSKNVATVTGLLRAGRVVDEPPDAEHRRPLRQVRRHAARPVEPRRRVRRRRAPSPSNEVLNQSIGVWRARRVVRPDRQRPHRAQGELQPLRPAGRHRPRHQRQPADRRHARLPVDRSERQRQVQTSAKSTSRRARPSAAAHRSTTPTACVALLG